MSTTDEPPGMSEELVAALAEMTASLRSANDMSDAFTRATQSALLSIEGCQAASLSLLGRDGFVTQAATAPIAEEGDRIQYDAEEGPCLSAAGQKSWVYSSSLRRDERWPVASARLADELGVGSILAARMDVGSQRQPVLGVINLYAKSEDAFGEEDQILTLLLASLTSALTHHAQVQTHLQEALITRQTIGEAVGILRGQTGVSGDEAFAMLVTASSRMNVKLRVIAERLTDGTLPYLPAAWSTASKGPRDSSGPHSGSHTS